MNDSLIVQLLATGVLYGTPLLIAGLGELVSERGGILNLGLEGTMLMGAVAGFYASQQIGGSSFVAVVCALLVAMIAGGVMSSILAFAAITLRASQIVAGLALTILAGAGGLSSFIGQTENLSAAEPRHAIEAVNLFGLSDLPVVGPLLFHQNPMVYISWLLVPAVGIYLWRTRPGLHLRAVGEEPRAADAMGISVVRYRYLHTIFGGTMAGLAGATYSLAITPSWTDGMTAGAGWIAIALVIFALWRPFLVLIGAYLFGVVTSLGFTFQARGVDLPPELYSSLPYVMTIISLVLVSTAWAAGRIGAPKGLGTPYSREEL